MIEIREVASSLTVALSPC